MALLLIGSLQSHLPLSYKMSLQPGQPEIFVDDNHKTSPEAEKLPQSSGGVHVDAAISAGIAANVEDFWVMSPKPSLVAGLMVDPREQSE